MTLATTAAISSSRSPALRIATLALAFGLCGPAAVAQAPQPDSENGRYSFSPTADGVLRLDTRNGKVSTCSNKGNGWACYAIADERAAFEAETSRLQGELERVRQQAEALRADNDRLKAQLAQREPSAGKTDEAMPKGDQLPRPEITSKDGQRKLEIPLPSDQDVDRVMGFIERAWRRLVEIAVRVQRDVSGDDKL